MTRGKPVIIDFQRAAGTVDEVGKDEYFQIAAPQRAFQGSAVTHFTVVSGPVHFQSIHVRGGVSGYNETGTFLAQGQGEAKIVAEQRDLDGKLKNSKTFTIKVT